MSAKAFYDDCGDSAEMINRCLNCAQEYCSGNESCAMGKKLLTKPHRSGLTEKVAELCLEGKNRSEIGILLHMDATVVRNYLLLAVNRKLITKKQMDDSRVYLAYKKGGHDGVHSEETSADR